MRFNFDVWLRSEYRTWPNGLGFDDQDPDLVADFQTLLVDLDYQMHFLKRNAAEGKKKDPKATGLAEPLPPPAPSSFESL